MNGQDTTGLQFPVVVPAAGIGKRMAADRPKQYLTIAGETILQRTVERLISHPNINRVVLALHPEDQYFEQLPCAKAPWLTTVVGGAERADSVLAALAPIQDTPWVLVHDAARPCVLHRDISALLSLADSEQPHDSTHGGILAYPVRDTMKQARSQPTPEVQQTLERNGMWHALTPQFFPTQALYQALQDGLAAGANITDEASAIERIGGTVSLITGCASNIKVTRPEDLALANFYWQQQENP